MCGIAGLRVAPGQHPDPAIVRRMTDAIAHRGPDGQGAWADDSACLGHRRLAIVDLSEAGRQPMLDDRGEIAVTYNGEIYNFLALRAAIERECGYRFRSRCDAEVLPIGWRLWGEALFDRLEGMYAVAIWDRRDGTLVLARDPVGIKPLYVARAGDAVLFCSEPKGLVASGLLGSPRVDPCALHAYLGGGYPDPDASLIAGVRQVPPGTLVRHARDGATRARRFWQPRREATVADPQEALRRVRETLAASVDDMLASADVPVGILLSGGIDSTLVALLSARGSACFSARFGEASHDESATASLTARRAGLPWHAVPVDADEERQAHDFVAMVKHLDGHLADASALAHYALSREVRRHIKVVLAGDGADEFFAGYPTYQATGLAEAIAPAVPRALAGRASAWAFAHLGGRAEGRMPWQDTLARLLAGLARAGRGQHAEWRRLLPPDTLPSLYGPALREQLHEDALAAYRALAVAGAGHVVDRALLADQAHYLPADMLVKVDRMSMAHGLEVRVPFLDRRVMTLAGRLDRRLLAGPFGARKRVLRRLAAALDAPPEVVGGAKRGFNFPIARALRRGLRALGDEILDRDAGRLAPELEPGEVRRLWREHQAGTRNHAYALWAILCHGVWRASLADGAAPPR